jgi:hypothetical protein
VKPEETALILRCWELICELVENEPPEWATWDYEPWREQILHGPRYQISRWFGALRERDRVRYRRAIDSLEARGMVTTYRAWGTRLTHVGLTDEGIELAEQLRHHAAAKPTSETALDD